MHAGDSRPRLVSADGDGAHQELPRLTVMASPLTAPAASLTRKAMTAATSSGSTTRPAGEAAAHSFQISDAVVARSLAVRVAVRSAMSVRTQPGHTALQVTPNGATSWATARASPTSPCFELQYAD